MKAAAPKVRQAVEEEEEEEEGEEEEWGLLSSHTKDFFM